MAAVRDVLRADSFAKRIEAEVLAKQAANVQGGLHRPTGDSADDPTFSSRKPYIPNYEQLTPEEEKERERCLLNFLQNVSQGADAKWFAPPSESNATHDSPVAFWTSLSRSGGMARFAPNLSATNKSKRPRPSKQSTIHADEDKPPHRPSSESRVAALHGAGDGPLPYPRGARRGRNSYEGYFDSRSGTVELDQQSQGVGATDSSGQTWRYGNRSVDETDLNVGPSGDLGTPGAHLDADMRPRQGEAPTPRGSRKRPPAAYGTTDLTTRVIQPDAHLLVEQDSDGLSQNEWRKPALTGRGPVQPRRRKPSRRQGYLE
jgi:hypothetical protein